MAFDVLVGLAGRCIGPFDAHDSILMTINDLGTYLSSYINPIANNHAVFRKGHGRQSALSECLSCLVIGIDREQQEL